MEAAVEVVFFDGRGGEPGLEGFGDEHVDVDVGLEVVGLWLSWALVILKVTFFFGSASSASIVVMMTLAGSCGTGTLVTFLRACDWSDVELAVV